MMPRLQCFDTVGWASGRASGLWKLSDGVLAWLSVWSEVQIVCIWSSWCHCIPSTIASLKSRLVLPLWYRLTQVVLKKRPLNGCSVVAASHNARDQWKCCVTGSTYYKSVQMKFTCCEPAFTVSHFPLCAATVNCTFHDWRGGLKRRDWKSQDWKT